MSKLLGRLREKRVQRRRAKAERAYQENREGVPRRGSGAPRSGVTAGKGYGGGGG